MEKISLKQHAIEIMQNDKLDFNEKRTSLYCILELLKTRFEHYPPYCTRHALDFIKDCETYLFAPGDLRLVAFSDIPQLERTYWLIESNAH